MAEAGDKSHQDLYKSKVSSWKELYRQKCMERLREKRAKQHSQRRNLSGEDSFEAANTPQRDNEENKEIMEVMENEWDTLRFDVGKDFQYKNMSFTASTMIDEIMAFFEVIKKEMLEQEENRRKHTSQLQCDDHFRREEDEICESMKALSTYQVICPLCEKYNLVEHNFLILCRCGLTINTEQDCINMKHIHDNLESATTDHSNVCEEKPVFSFVDRFGISNLIMSCGKCDFLFIIV